MNINDVKDKIKKLLALSEDSTYDAESFSALQKAQELMAKYKLEKSDIIVKEKEDCIKKRTILSYGTRSSDHYLAQLAQVVADNFCVVTYITTFKNSRTHHIEFMGTKEDVHIACEILYAANSHIVRGYNRIWKELCDKYSMDYIPARIFNPLKSGYAKGYIAGLSKRLQEQKEQHNEEGQEWGLVLVAPQEALDFMAELSSADFGRDRYSTDYYNEGYNDGKSFSVDEKISSGREN